MELNPLGEANKLSPSHGNSYMLWKPQVHYSIH